MKTSKTKTTHLIICLVLFLTHISNSYSQITNSIDGCGTLPSTNMGSLTNIPVKTPGSNDYLRALIVYITFPDDTVRGDRKTIWKSPSSIPNSRPINPNPGTGGHLINPLVGDPNIKFMDRYPNYTLSDFFCEMSMGQFDFIGDEIAITLPYPSTYYKAKFCHRGCMNRYVLQYIDSLKKVNWSRYDNWSNNNGWIFGVPDGNPEMIIMNYRRIPNNENGWFWDPSYGGEASLGISPITFGNVTITSENGVTALNLLYATGRAELILEHEISHKMFGYSIPGGAQHINLGFMTPTHSGSIYTYSPMERSAPVLNYTPINIIDQNGVYTKTLPDFIQSGVSYKVKVPGTSEYVWLANHQKKSVYDGISRGGKTCYPINQTDIDPYCPDGKGLYVYREGYGCSNLNQPYDIVCSEGRFNWQLDRNVYVPSLGINLPIFNNVNGSRYNGKDEYRKYVSTFAQLLTDNECSDNPNDFAITWDDKGDGLDAFNMGYEEIFSPYSNPSSSSCNPNNKGLTMRLMNQNTTTGSIDVKIYLENDALALLECPPSKPKKLNSSKSYITSTPNQFYPKITWDANIEPDFSSTTYGATAGASLIAPMYEIYRGSSTNCNVEPTYTYLNSVSNTTTQFIDYTVKLSNQITVGDASCISNFVTYSYKIVAKDNRGMRSLKSERAIVSGYNGNCSVVASAMKTINGEEEINNADQYYISNYPNPFSSNVNISFGLPLGNFITLKIFDALGSEVSTLVNTFKEAGNYTVSYDTSELPSGIYYCKIQADNFTQVNKMILVK